MDIDLWFVILRMEENDCQEKFIDVNVNTQRLNQEIKKVYDKISQVRRGGGRYL